MKKLELFLSIVFLALTLIGAGYVLYRRGAVSAGYAAVPMVLALVSLLFYRGKR
ncbi:MAG: hypothetical protein HFJ86_01250 [Oscillospiraceae bacterium]|jgi:hypothetical protein|nr:hypothetical protein [Oscillospiraceae bacterium]